jgi:hypothetical protein
MVCSGNYIHFNTMDSQEKQRNDILLVTEQITCIP